MMKKILTLCTLVSTLCASNHGSMAGSFLRTGISARSIAMGGGFTAEMDHSFAAFHNPAWAGFLQDQHVGSSYTNMTLDRRLAATSFATPLPPTGGLGIAWINAGVTDIQGRYSTGEKSTMMQTGENAVVFTFAQRIMPWISIGANVKILRYDLPVSRGDELTGTGIGFDIGILIKSGSYQTLGIMVQDLSSGYQWNTNDVFSEGPTYKDEFPTIYRIGSRYLKNGLSIVGDLGVITDHETFADVLPRAGIEYGFLEQYFFRTGFGNNRIGFGGGYRYGLFNNQDSWIDYTFSLDLASQTAHTISYAIRF